MRQFATLVVAALARPCLGSGAMAEGSDETRIRVHRNVVGIMAGSMSGTDMSLANDLGLAFSEGYDLRVIPMVGLGGARMSSVVFDTFGIDVEVTTFSHKVILKKLRSGEISAMMRASGKPVSIIEAVKPGEPFHLPAVPQDPLSATYGPTTLTADGYPALIEPGQSVSTVAGANALIGYNWGRDHFR